MNHFIVGLSGFILAVAALFSPHPALSAPEASIPESARASRPPGLSPEEIYIPPGVPRSTQPPLSGEALDNYIREQLKQQFNAADTNRTGRVTIKQAEKAGWGYLVNHFNEIDRNKSGSVTFEDILSYMRSQGARL